MAYWRALFSANKTFLSVFVLNFWEWVTFDVCSLGRDDMKRALLLTTLLLSACASSDREALTYASAVGKATKSVNGDAVFASAEGHAKCAGFHRAFAKVSSGSASKVEFFHAAAKHARMAATEIASASISKELAANMIDELAETHAARWAYLIEADAESAVVQSQAETCFDKTGEQEVIIRDAMKAKYGFRKP
jgi:hypothetical protein